MAFPSISTGVYHFPLNLAAPIAVKTVRDFLDRRAASIERVIFNVFKDLDKDIYRRLLGPDRTAA